VGLPRGASKSGRISLEILLRHGSCPKDDPPDLQDSGASGKCLTSLRSRYHSMEILLLATKVIAKKIQLPA